MTQQELVLEFLNGECEEMSDKNGNLRINKDHLIHYQTAISQKYDDKVIVNVTRYSIVTGRIQKMLIDSIVPENLITAHKVPEGYRGDLRQYVKTD